MKRFLLMFMLCLTGSWFYGLVAGDEKQDVDPDRHAAALKVIERNLEALGGADKIRSIHSMQLKGGQGQMLTLPSMTTDYYLAGPDRFKSVSGTEVVLLKGEKKVYNAGEGEQPLPDDFMENNRFQIELMKKGFSPLVWEAFFDKAEYLGKKRHGPEKEYAVLIPEAQGGQDLTLYFDTKTYLLNRIVFKIKHERAKTLTYVTRLKNYETFGEIKVPTTLYFERVGWKEQGLQFLISDCVINPELDDALFEDVNIDYGTVKREEGRLTGEIRADRFTLMHTNASDEDMAAMGISDGDHVVICVGDCSVEARYVQDFVPSQEELQSRAQPILCKHPRAGYPRLLLLPVPGSDFMETFTFSVGDEFVLTKAEQK